ncbi:MAG: adenylosuccinate lyase [Deltaproteobacteria bacterium]|jgi:adenylosuccinate lyase|nr:adenylosuccinate lyase [Deltaproteobacteria bacterium]
MIERYTRPEMGGLWTEQSRLEAWLEVELAVCEAWCELGRIPKASLENIRRSARVDLPGIQKIEARVRHDLIAFLTSLEEIVGPDARFIHVGCTSSDIVDTAWALLLTRAGRLILRGLDELLAVMKALALRHKGLICMGRTHGVHAEPTSFGLKMAGFYAEFARHRARLADALEGVRCGKISGAVGTYAMLDPRVEELALARLGLEPDPVSTQIIQRDRHAHFCSALALLGGGVERLALELRHLQRTEVLEVEEGFAQGQKGSSAMPHKKNPISAENLCGLSRLLRGNALTAMENTALWHERDISHSSAERVILPDSSILADYMLHRLKGLLEGLRVMPENMRRNLLASHELFYSQRVLLALVEEAALPRQEAYALVQACAMQSWENKASFQETVRAHPVIAARLAAESLDRLFDQNYYLRHEDMIFRRVFGGDFAPS